jgi:hypothetical protein
LTIKHYRPVREGPDSWVLKDEDDNFIPDPKERFVYDSQARAEQQAARFNRREIGCSDNRGTTYVPGINLS